MSSIVTISSFMKRRKEKLKVEDIANGTGYKVRSVRYTLGLLQKEDKISRIPDLYDLRSYYYIWND